MKEDSGPHPRFTEEKANTEKASTYARETAESLLSTSFPAISSRRLIS